MRQTPERKAENEFSKGRWHRLKMRWISGLSVVIFPIFGVVYLWFIPEAYDPLWQRLLGVIISTLTFAASFRQSISNRKVEYLFLTLAFSMTAQTLFLVYANDISPAYVLGAYCMMFCASASLSSLRQSLVYFAFCLSIILAMAWAKPGENAVFLTLGACTFGLVSSGILKTMLHLIAQIEKTRDRIEVKNRELDGLLNALGQGFISFGPDGKCSPVYSAACREIFEMDPAAQSVLSLLRIPQDKHPILETKIKEAFAQRNFDLLFKVLPREFTNSMGRYITFEYRVGQLDASGNVLHAIIVATDRTAQMKAEKAVELERRHSMMIATIVKQKRFFRLFLSDLRAGLEKFVGHSVQPENEEQVSLEFKRFLHSIKGGFGMFWMEDHAKAVHEMEAEWKAQALSGDGMRIQRQAVRIQSLINGFIEKNMDVLGNEFRTDRVIEIPLGSWIPVLSQAETDGSVALQKTLFEMTLLPIGRFFEPFSELSIKIARSQRKKLLPLEFRGADLMLYPEPYATLFTTCVHLFRNAVDHGLETPEEREAAGKNAAGRIRVSFSEEQSEGRTWICVRVSDDGRGIDPERIRRARNLPADLPVNQVLDTVFAPGFTTRETVTEISGRGEGLFATREAARELGGEITVTSKLGEGSEFVLRVPRLAVQTSAPKSVQQGLKRGA